jgi:hypothetical protein
MPEDQAYLDALEYLYSFVDFSMTRVFPLFGRSVRSEPDGSAAWNRWETRIMIMQ